MTLATDLVTVADVAAWLNWSSSQQANYSLMMESVISAATYAVEEITGPVVTRDFDEWYTGGRQRLQTEHYPIVAITSIDENWGAGVTWTLTEQVLDGIGPWDAYGYTVDYAKGLIYRRWAGIIGDFATGVKNVHVQYTAGMCADTPSVPKNIWQATLELIRFNWQPVQGGNRPTAQTDAMAGQMFAGFFVPNRVMEMLRPNSNRFAIA